MKRLILIIVVFLTLISCIKEKGENFCQLQTFAFLNEKNEDLFDKKTLNYIDTSELKAFTTSGKQLFILSAIIDSLCLHDIYFSQIDDTTILKIGELTYDTIITQFKEKGNTTYISQLYYNGVLLVNNEDIMCEPNLHKIIVKEE